MTTSGSADAITTSSASSVVAATSSNSSAVAIPDETGSASTAPAYTWSRAMPEGLEVDLGEATADVVYPVFSTTLEDKAVVNAINADVRAKVGEAYANLAYWKSWAYVYLYPEVTLLNDEYLAVHYYHVYNAGTAGTLSIAGDGELYRLSDGSKCESPAEMLRMSEEDILSLADHAIDDSGIRQQNVYQGRFTGGARIDAYCQPSTMKASSWVAGRPRTS